MLTFYGEQCTYALFMDPQISFFINFFIKNGFHITIHTFKNYFATVFSVFSFQFQQNKFYPNTPVVLLTIILMINKDRNYWRNKTFVLNKKNLQSSTSRLQTFLRMLEIFFDKLEKISWRMKNYTN